jgi:hypothetical protein
MKITWFMMLLWRLFIVLALSRYEDEDTKGKNFWTLWRLTREIKPELNEMARAFMTGIFVTGNFEIPFADGTLTYHEES